MTEDEEEGLSAADMLSPWRGAAVLFAALLPGLWLGLLVGVSFIATPVKFLAPGLSLPVALEIGRATFHLFTTIEIVLAGALVLALVAARAARWKVVAALAIALVVAVQTGWLLPLLDLRVAVIVDGGTAPESGVHVLYAGLDGIKALGLLALAVAAALASLYPAAGEMR